ncbi:MAG: magnesium-translocating P-type ATPase [Streptococcaceae bacterium]|jgi:Mg2+-importing ATPase|nr:magnesium-translocating P-type ATPase [Streptococcaceae bacterium]
MQILKVNQTGKIVSERIQAQNSGTSRKQEIYNSSAASEIQELFNQFQTNTTGLTEKQVSQSRLQYGDNQVSRGKKVSLGQSIIAAFVNPFTAILSVLVIVSVFTDVIFVPAGEKNFTTIAIICTMVVISGSLRFFQENKSGHAAENLLRMITTTCSVSRQEYEMPREIPIEELVVGDIVHLAAGDMIPADLRIIQAKDLFLSQSALTGESIEIEKTADPFNGVHGNLTEIPNLAFMGTNVISGSAKGLVIRTGNETFFGEMAKSMNCKHAKTSFETGINKVSWLLIRFMLVMVPIVLFINGFSKGNWGDALLFALSVAVGLTPEMLPMVVTTSLAKGAVAMSKEKTIIKNLNSIQNLGSMDILCTDKTGTLTQDKVVLEYHLNLQGKEDSRVLRHAFLNSFYQTGLKNLIDHAIIQKVAEKQDQEAELQGLSEKFVKVDEIPFDFTRRRMSVVVQNGKTQMITKGAVEEMLSISSFAESNGKVLPLTDSLRQEILDRVKKLNREGLRVIAVAQKTNPSPVGEFSVADESEMVLMGYLAFLDPPKESTAGAIQALNEHGVAVKVLTGDNNMVTRQVCLQVGIPVDQILLGSEVDQLSDAHLAAIAEKVSVFAKLSPQQKARIISALRNNGHSVGYMGDGINDAAAMKASDAGISVDTAVDIAKESADIILLEKDLMVLEKGIIEGRKTYANMIKYIKMTASSNFGNMFSVLIASAFLPFLPMLPLHVILLNLIYDLSCTAIPWDNVDKEYLAVPRKWDASSIGKFMLCIGPTSSVFDICTYLLMYFVICPMMTGGLLFHQISDPATQVYYIALFQAGWFVESMWSQTLVIHMIRSPKIPFIQNRASFPLIVLSTLGIVCLTIIPFTGFGHSIGLASLPIEYFGYLAVIILLYMLLATLAKKLFVWKYGELL